MIGQTYLLWSQKHKMWWRANEWGFTSVMAEAGRYSWWDAVRLITHSADHGDPTQVSVMVTAPDGPAVDGPAGVQFEPVIDRSGHRVWLTADGLIEWTVDDDEPPGEGWVRLYRPAGGAA